MKKGNKNSEVVSYKYKIYQINDRDDSKRRKLYLPWSMIENVGGFNFGDYREVWSDEIQVVNGEMLNSEILEKIFEMFNLNHPENYHGRSLSVSDVVVLDGVKYYCDSFGWKLI